MNPLGLDAPGPARPHDLRLLGPAVATWLASLAATAAGPGAGAAMSALLFGAAAAAVPLLRSPRGGAVAGLLVAALLCAAAASLAAAGRGAAVAGSPVTARAAERGHAELDAVITGDPRSRAGPPQPGRPELVVEARTSRIDVHGERTATRVPVVLLVSGAQWRTLVPSQRVRFSGRLLPAGDDPLTAALVAVRGPPSHTTAPTPAHTAAAEVRARLRAACTVLPQPERGLVPAFVVGDTSRLPERTAEDFRASGMTHLLTVSGANLAILTGAVLALARWSRWPTGVTVAAGALMIGVFILVARPEPSVLRAAFMGAVALLALALGRRRAGMAALSATVIGLLLFDPGLAHSYGFALSVLASGGIMVLAPRWRDRWAARMPEWAAEALAVPLAAHVACAPVLVLLSAEVSWVAIPANALTGPLMPIATVGGFAVAVLALVWPGAAAVAVWVPAVPVLWARVIAEYCAGIRGGAVPWRGDLLGACVLALLLVLALSLRGRVRRVAAAAGTAVATGVFAAQCAAPSWPPNGWLAVACDVGQGDAIALATGGGGAAVVDTGLDPAQVDRCLDDLGVDEVSLLVLTHGDADHVGGTSGVLDGRRVAAAAAPPGFDHGRSRRALERARVPLRAVAAGHRFALGGWSFTVLWPGDRPAASSNDASVVLLARWSPPDGSPDSDVTVLLTGDIEESAQRSLLGDPAITEVDVLKVPHHGAKTQEPAFLAATRPRVTLTSVGADNTYGHPAPRTWRHLESLTTANYRTDRHGDIAVLPGRGGPAVTHRPPAARDR
ncbi:competence protein ComEC [Murinocardiopsis flavida]|uniref:Competence protein ComEC n=1 Tax=Murinocardiopsis flavida TaxID=645275 RepID=A0A2P8DUS5_9ACTN|nr:ComEC/Rec2 family competence protein [Murinocardiopsis flavida]PSL00966.1 competence protein ComEC [Murinocardiopsis flavida]